MRNIISLQLEPSSCSTSLMVYSKCLVNIKAKRPVRNTDLRAGGNWFSLQEYITIVERGFGNDRENTRGGNYTTWCEWCPRSATVIKMLRISISPFIDDGCCLRMWSLHPILPVEYSFTDAQSNIGWMTKMDGKAPRASASGQSLYQTLNNTVPVHTQHSTLPDYPTFRHCSICSRG